MASGGSFRTSWWTCFHTACRILWHCFTTQTKPFEHCKIYHKCLPLFLCLASLSVMQALFLFPHFNAFLVFLENWVFAFLKLGCNFRIEFLENNWLLQKLPNKILKTCPRAKNMLMHTCSICSCGILSHLTVTDCIALPLSRAFLY